MTSRAATYSPRHEEPDNPFGMASETYRVGFRTYDDVAHALCLAEDVYAQMARRRFRAHACGSKKQVSA
ncbi:MAG: hypothetical protein AAFW98_03690 [Pseudomonadota bacterium]